MDTSRMRREVGEMTQITVQNPHTRKRQKLVLTNGGPVPENGDICTIKGVDWVVIKVDSAYQPIATFSTEAGKLKQVFP